MYISKVILRNYRNFRNSKFEFKKGINTIIGENGSGKTNVFRAIRLILDDCLYRFAYKLNETDFNRSIGNWKGQWIIISVEFSELSTDEAIQALFAHSVGDAAGTKLKKATYNLYFRPNASFRKKLSELEDDDKEGLGSILDNLSISDYETVFTGKGTADFTDDETYKGLVGDFDAVNFNYDINREKFGVKIPHQLSISKEVSFTFIQALRDVVSEFYNNRTNPLLNLLQIQSEEINEEEFSPISTQVKDLNKSIEELEDIKRIQRDIKNTIKEAVGYTYSPSLLSIKSSLSEDAEKLLQSLNLFIGEPNEDYEGSIYELSLGGANLIYLTLKLLEYKYSKGNGTLANFLLIEEPEAHIHTHIQKSLFNNINFPDTQIIYSTHSTHISEACKISKMNILAKKSNFAEVYQPSIGLEESYVVKLERYLDAVRSNLLFAKGVLLVEGDAEEILIPVMTKKILGVSLDELGISLINIRSTGFENVARIFSDKRIRRRCAIITDLDTAIEDTEKGAEKKGLERKKRLDKFVKDNEWVELFCAKYTFEVDFVGACNYRIAEKMVSEVYTDPKKIKESKEELNSKDVKKYGKRILTMAKQEGKGWFAISLSKYIDYLTYMPQYILDAINFVIESDEKLISQMVQYQIQKAKDDEIDECYDKLKKMFDEYKNGCVKLEDVTSFAIKKLKNNHIPKILNMLK